jgi:hypothetical protein
MSRSVQRDCSLSVPVCPTVPAKQSLHPLKETTKPLGENALSCETLRWLFHCFLANTGVFLPRALRSRTRTLFCSQGTPLAFFSSFGKAETFPLIPSPK